MYVCMYVYINSNDKHDNNNTNHTSNGKERELARELGEARDGAARWSSVAKRQDTMLQQEPRVLCVKTYLTLSVNIKTR